MLSMFVCAVWGEGGEGRYRRVCGLGVWCVRGGRLAPFRLVPRWQVGQCHSYTHTHTHLPFFSRRERVHIG